MKNIIYLLLGFFCFLGCKEASLQQYEGVNALKFNYTLNGKDSVRTTFRMLNKDTIYISQVVQATGQLVNYPRKYKVQVDQAHSTAIEGKDFAKLLDTFSIAAGANKDTIRIKLIKNDNLNDQELKLHLQLLANENFALVHKPYILNGNVVNYDIFRIKFSNNYIIGPTWDVAVMGNFSQKKLQLLVEKAGMELVPFYTLYGYSSSKYIAFARTLRQYLRDQKALGIIIYDEENKEEMQMGSSI